MRKYEIMFIVRPDLEEAAMKKVVEDMKSAIEANDAKVVDTTHHTVDEVRDIIIELFNEKR